MLKRDPRLPSYAQLVRLVDELTDAVHSELHAAGPDEVKQHPMLRAKQRVYDRAARTLKRIAEVTR